MKMIQSVLIAAVLGVSLAGLAGRVRVDFATSDGDASDGATPPEGWVYSSIGKSDGTANFNAKADYIMSPEFNHVITNVFIECMSSNDSVVRRLRVIPVEDNSDGIVSNESDAVIFEPQNPKGTQSAKFKEGSGVRKFSIGLTQSGGGTWKVFSAEIIHTGPDELEAAAGLRSEEVSTNSFKAVWNVALAAESYALRVWSVDVADPTYANVAFGTGFDGVVNTGKSSKPVTDDLPTLLGEGWEGALVYAPTNTEGVVQIGNSSDRGWLTSPAWTGSSPAENQSLLIRARRASGKNAGYAMPVSIVRGDAANAGAAVTNAVGTVSLTDQWEYYNLPLSDLAVGDRFLFHSITNGSEKRVWLDSAKVVSGYAPGVVTTNEIFFAEGIASTERTVEGLEEGVCHWAVRSDAAGEDGIWSESVTVNLAEPPPDDTPGGSGGGEGNDIPTPIDFLLDAWRVSQMADDARTADFGIVTNIVKSATGNWTNGVSIVGVYAFKDADAHTQLRFDTRKATAGGLYASHTNTINETSYSLSLLGASGNEHSIEIPICNDDSAHRRLIGFNVDFNAYQWTFKGEGAEDRRLLFEWAATSNATSRPAAAGWNMAEGATFTSLPTLPEACERATYYTQEKSFSIDEISVPHGGVLWIRWRTEKKSAHPVMGINEVRISVRFETEPTLIRVR